MYYNIKLGVAAKEDMRIYFQWFPNWSPQEPFVPQATSFYKVHRSKS